MGCIGGVAAQQATVGLVAGNGKFPLEFVENARQQGCRTVVAAHKGETDPSIEQLADKVFWVKVGQFQKILSFFQRERVERLAFLGGIRRAKLFRSMWPDRRALRVIARVGSIRDDEILRGAVQEFESCGLSVISPVEFLPESCPSSGPLTKRELTASEFLHAQLGWKAAKTLGQFDVGQSVAINSGVVVALEGAEGTDQMIQRAGALSGPGSLIVKVPKPQQDLRVDMPAIGPATLQAMVQSGCRALVVEAEKSLILDPEQVRREADKHSIAILAATEETITS